MKSIFALLFVICCFVATLHGKHTLKVDNVYPNFGETVLISGPLTTDRLGSDTLNVGELNILSKDGINITTRGDFTLSGAGIDAKNSQNLTIAATGANATFSVVAATTISFNGENAAIGSNGVVTLAALGDFGFTGGDFLVFANKGLLQGDYLNIVSEEGHVIARSFGGLNASSSAFSAKAIDFLELSAANTFTLDALQSISLESSYTSLVSDSLVVRADRNNALLSGYAGTTLIANSFQARVKGDATITAANGVINYSELQNLRMIANDDFEIFAHDAATFTANGDARITASNTLYMLSDNESHFQFGSGSISANNNLDMFSGARLLMKSGNDESLRVVNGPFIATAADYAMFNADQALAFTARQDINLLGEQGIDIRAERSTVFLGRGKNSLSNNKPITYASLSNIETRASDLRLDVATLSINAANAIAFTSEQSIRDSRVQFDSATNTTVTATNAFGWSGNTVNVQASRDLTLTASGAIDFGYANAGDYSNNQLSITNGGSFTQTTSGLVDDSNDQLIYTAADEIRVQVAQNLNVVTNELNVRFGGDFVVLAPEMRLAAEKSAVFETGAYSIVGSSSVLYNTGAFNLDVTGTVSYSVTDDFTVNALNGNIQHDADLFTANIDDTSNYNAARNVIINGEQSYDYESAVFNGNFVLVSPPGGDIIVGGDNVTIAGPASLVASFVNINVDNDLTFEPFTFTVTSFVEQPITINVGDDLSVYGYEVFFRADPLDYDHEFFFNIDNSFTVTADDQIDMDFRFLTEFRVGGDATITQQSGSPALPDFLHFIGHEMSLTANAASFTSEIDDVHIIANGGVTRLHALENINVATTHAHLRGAETYLRSLGEITQVSASYTMMVRDTFQLYGGDATITSGSLDIGANSDINIYTSGDFTVSSVNTANLIASELFDMHSKLITFEAPQGTNFVNADEGVAISSAENRTLSIQQFNADGANTIESTGDSISFLANDELRFMIDGDVAATAGQNVLFQTSAQSADQYFGSGSTVITAGGLVAFNAFDVAFREGNVVVDATTAAFTASQDVSFTASGTEYDPLTADEYAFLARGKRTVSLTAEGDINTNDARSLSFYSATSSYSHTSVTDITLESLQDGLMIRSADDITLFSSAAGDFVIGNYSTWQTTRDLTWTVGTDFTWASSGDFDVHADRGEIFFQNSAVFDDTLAQSTTFTANSIVGEGADNFAWTTGDTIIDSGAVELYGDSALAFTSTGTVTWTASRDGLVSSSTNNDILYEATGTWTSTADFISVEARSDTIWRAGGLTFTASDSQKLTSKGSVDIESDAATTVTATTGDVTFQQRNSASFEALGDILVGSVTPGIVTINTGGSAQAYGQSWTAKDTLSVESLNGVRLESTVYRVRSDSEISVSAVTGLTIESQGVETIGQDIYFEATGAQTFTAENSIALVGGSARYEYDNSLTISAGTNLLLQSSTFIRADVEQDLQQDAPLLAVNTAAYSYQSKGDSEYISTVGSGLTQFTATKTTTTLQSQDNMNFVGTNTLNIFTTASNAPIIIETQGVDSNIYSTTEGSSSTSNGASSILAKNGVLITDFASATISAADTYRAVSSGDYEYNAAVITKTSQGEISYDSRANLFGNLAGVLTLSATRDLIFSADKDIAFNVSPGIDDNPVQLTMSVDGLTDLGFGGDWNFHSDFDTLILAGAADWRAVGINGVLISSQGDFLINQLLPGQTFVTANNLRAESLQLATFTSSADSLYQTNNGTQFSALEQPTDLLFTGNALTVNAADNIELAAFGFLPSSGTVVISATGTTTNPDYAYFLNAQLPLTQQTITPGLYSNLFLASENDVEVNAQQARFAVENSGGIYVYQPEQAGSSLLFAADGADENNRGIEIQGNSVLLQSLRNVIHRSNSMYFHEVASDQTIGVNTNTGRPTMFSFRDQVYDASGGNVNGNGIQIQSDAPSHSISFDVDNVVFDSGNGVLIDTELGAVFNLTNDASFYTHQSVYIAGQGNNVADSSVYFSTGEIDTDNGGIAAYGSDMRFFADDDLLVRSVDHILADIENRLFLEGGNIVEVYGAQGVNVYTTHPNNWSSVGSTINIEAQNDIHITSGNVIEFNSPTTTLTAIPQEGPNRGNIFIGTPNVAESAGISVGGGANIVFNSRNVEIGSDAALVFPVLPIGSTLDCNTPGRLSFSIEVSNLNPVPYINFCDQANVVRRVRLIADNLV